MQTGITLLTLMIGHNKSLVDGLNLMKKGFQIGQQFAKFLLLHLLEVEFIGHIFIFCSIL